MDIVDKFKALSDETRLKIVEILMSGRKTVSEIVPLTGKSQPNVSISLKILLQAQIITKTKVGTFVYYELKNPQKIKQMFSLLKNGN